MSRRIDDMSIMSLPFASIRVIGGGDGGTGAFGGAVTMAPGTGAPRSTFGVAAVCGFAEVCADWAPAPSSDVDADDCACADCCPDCCAPCGGWPGCGRSGRGAPAL